MKWEITRRKPGKIRTKQKKDKILKNKENNGISNWKFELCL